MTRELADLRSLPLFPLLERAFDGLAVVAPQPWRIVYANSTLADWLDAATGDLVGRCVEAVFRGSCKSSFADMLDSAASAHQEERTLVADLLAGQQQRMPVEIRPVPLVLNAHSLLGLVVRKVADSQQNVARPAAERRDPLTSLPDRAFLLERLNALLHREREGNRRFAVLFVDLDNFKQINDAHGHLVGDTVVQEVARRLSASVRDGDCVVRYGGDEFVVIVDEVERLEDVQPVIHRLHAALREPISLPDEEATLTASIGAAIPSPSASTPEDLLLAADRDMYASKQSRAG